MKTNLYISILKKINFKELGNTLIYTFIFGMVAHGFCYLNTNFSHDSLTLIYNEGFDSYISIGRYIRPLYMFIRSGFALPWLAGLLSLLFFGVSFYFIIDCLNIKNKIFKILTCGILVTNYSVSILNASYIHDADSYVLSLLLVSFGLWISLKQEKGYLISIITE